MAERHVDVITAHEGSVLALGYSPSGQFIVSGGGDGAVAVWDMRRHRFVDYHTDHQMSVWSVAFSPTGDHIGSMGRDGSGRIVGLDGKVSKFAGRPTAGFQFVPPSGQLLALDGGYGAVVLWDASTDAKTTLYQHSEMNDITALAVSRDGRYVASCCSEFRILVYDLKCSYLRSLQFHRRPVKALAFSHDGKCLASGDTGGILCYWDIAGPAENPQLTFQWSGHEVRAVDFSPDGIIFGAAADGRIILFDRNNGNRLLEDLIHSHGTVTDVQFSPDGRSLASAASDNTIKVWNIKNPDHVA